MKKICILFMLVVAILIPTDVVNAVDVSSFSRVADNYAPFKTKDIWRNKTGLTYYYECSVDLRENFASQYINLLKQYGITYVGHESKDFRRTSTQYIDKLYFNCRGQRFEVWQYRYFAEGRITFPVKLPYMITYEED